MYHKLIDEYDVKFLINDWISQLDNDTDYYSIYETWVHSDFDPRFEPTALRYGVSEGSPQCEKVGAYHVFPAFEVSIINRKKYIGGKTMPQHLNDVRIELMNELSSKGFTMAQIAMIFNVHLASVIRSVDPESEV